MADKLLPLRRVLSRVCLAEVINCLTFADAMKAGEARRLADAAGWDYLLMPLDGGYVMWTDAMATGQILALTENGKAVSGDGPVACGALWSTLRTLPPNKLNLSPAWLKISQGA